MVSSSLFWRRKEEISLKGRHTKYGGPIQSRRKIKELQCLELFTYIPFYGLMVTLRLQGRERWVTFKCYNIFLCIHKHYRQWYKLDKFKPNQHTQSNNRLGLANLKFGVGSSSDQKILTRLFGQDIWATRSRPVLGFIYLFISKPAF